MEKDFNSLSTEKVFIYRVVASSDEIGNEVIKENFCSNLDVAINMQRELFCMGYYRVSIECVECYTKF